MSDSADLTGLHDIRLPADAPYQWLADGAAAVGLGLVLALALWPVLKRLTRKPANPHRDMEAVIARLSMAPDSTRIPALLRLLHENDPEQARAFGDALYRRGSLPDAETVETVLRRTVPR